MSGRIESENGRQELFFFLPIIPYLIDPFLI